MAGKKYVYSFGGGNSEGSGAMKELLGGKGANLAEMASLGLPVPPGFTITTECCVDYFKTTASCPPGWRSRSRPPSPGWRSRWA